MWCVVLVPVGEKEAEDKDVNSEAPSSLSEATSDKESNSVKSKKDEERNNSIKKVNLRIKFMSNYFCLNGANVTVSIRVFAAIICSSFFQYLRCTNWKYM